jgi:hypothetical protein
METITFKIKGVTPMLQHNDTTADPLNEYSKAMKRISSKRTKTEDDHLEMARIEMRAGLYWDEAVGLHIPGENVEACLIGAAKFKKLGTTFKRGAQVVDIHCPLVDTGAPENPDEIVADNNFRFTKSVKVGTSKVMRTRAIFDTWATEFTVMFEPTQLQREDIIEMAESAGAMVGLGDWRPRFGRFEVVEAA